MKVIIKMVVEMEYRKVGMKVVSQNGKEIIQMVDPYLKNVGMKMEIRKIVSGKI